MVRVVAAVVVTISYPTPNGRRWMGQGREDECWRQGREAEGDGRRGLKLLDTYTSANPRAALAVQVNPFGTAWSL